MVMPNTISTSHAVRPLEAERAAFLTDGVARGVIWLMPGRPRRAAPPVEECCSSSPNALRERFRRRSASSLEELAQLARTMQGRSPTDAERRHVLRILRRIAGGAGTFGLFRAARLAQVLSERVEAAHPASRSLAGLVEERLPAFADALDDEAERPPT